MSREERPRERRGQGGNDGDPLFISFLSVLFRGEWPCCCGHGLQRCVCEAKTKLFLVRSMSLASPEMHGDTLYVHE